MHRCRWLTIVVLLLASAEARAQGPNGALGPTTKQEAAERFERGVQLFKEQAFRAALVEFQRAYDLAPDYRLLYNVGRAKYHLHDYLGATQSLEAYLAEGGSDVAPERRAQVEETLASLRSRVGRISIMVNREGAEVFVDEVKVGTAPLSVPMLANVGRHRVSARAPDGAVAAEFVDVAGGDVADVRLTLAETQPARVAALSGQGADRSSGRSTQRKLAVATWITGGALLAAAAVTGGLSLHARSELDERIDTLGSRQADVEDQRNKVDTLSLTTDILVGVGAAAAITGTILWIADSSERRESASRTPQPARARLGVGVGLSSFALRGRF